MRSLVKERTASEGTSPNLPTPDDRSQQLEGMSRRKGAMTLQCAGRTRNKGPHPQSETWRAFLKFSP